MKETTTTTNARTDATRILKTLSNDLHSDLKKVAFKYFAMMQNLDVEPQHATVSILGEFGWICSHVLLLGTNPNSKKEHVSALLEDVVKASFNSAWKESKKIKQAIRNQAA